MTNTRLAKLVYSLSGKLSKIKTKQTIYKISNEDRWLDGTDEQVFWKRAGTRKLPCRLSVRTLSWSMKLDPLHWDHWALDHKGCKSAALCLDCKGYTCEYDDTRHVTEDTL